MQNIRRLNLWNPIFMAFGGNQIPSTKIGNRITIVFILFVFVGGIENCFAQNLQVFTISGVVYDDKGETLPSATIQTKNNPEIGWVTDFDGRFELEANDGDTLAFTYLGYQTYEYIVKEEVTDLEIVLEPLASALEEIVVVGMGE